MILLNGKEVFRMKGSAGNPRTLCERLQEAMVLRGMRAVDLSEKTGIPKGAISYYMSGKSKPKADRLYALAQTLDVSEAWLLGYDVPMNRTNNQKKNDQLAKLIVKLRTDENFYNTVMALASLSESKYRGIEQLVAALKE
jgi:transcriptional regulator with XRE-family HTH domain